MHPRDQAPRPGYPARPDGRRSTRGGPHGPPRRRRLVCATELLNLQDTSAGPHPLPRRPAAPILYVRIRVSTDLTLSGTAPLSPSASSMGSCIGLAPPVKFYTEVYTKRENAGSWNSGSEKATSELPIRHKFK